jgi:NAD(P)-dependent dehydrogenase (short-subunit alcohol dehydrogenase family)
MREALVDKVVMVTGVANGCGEVLAEAFAADGAEVVGCDTDVDAGRATAAAVRHPTGATRLHVPHRENGPTRGARRSRPLPLL